MLPALTLGPHPLNAVVSGPVVITRASEIVGRACASSTWIFACCFAAGFTVYSFVLNRERTPVPSRTLHSLLPHAYNFCFIRLFTNVCALNCVTVWFVFVTNRVIRNASRFG